MLDKQTTISLIFFRYKRIHEDMEPDPEAKNMENITVFKMMPFDTFVKCLKERGLKSSLPYSSANPMENLPQCKGETELAQKIQEAKDSEYVLMSFTKNVSSPTMWGLYGDGGAGVCLEFSFPEEPDDAPDDWAGQMVAKISRERKEEKAEDYFELNKMSYSRDSKRIRSSEFEGPLKRKLMLHKASEWNFEKEYRFVVPMSWASSNLDGDLYFREPLRYLKSVYLGPHCPHSPHYLSALIRLYLLDSKNDTPFEFKNDTKDISVRRACFDNKSFALHLTAQPDVNYDIQKNTQREEKSKTPDVANQTNNSDSQEEQLTLLYMYASASALENILDTWSLKASLTRAVNDPMECLPSNSGVSDPVALSSREGKAVYLCFSRKMSSPSMWGNYADEGKGACLAFLFPLIKAGKRGMILNPKRRGTCGGWEKFNWQEVVYNNQRASGSADDLTYRKAEDWEYEQEVRCFCDQMDADSATQGMLLYQLPMQFLAGVILGPRSQLATQYMQKKLELCLKEREHTIGNWPVKNKYIPWLLCSRACYHHTRYEFYAYPWLDHASESLFIIARKVSIALNLLKFPGTHIWNEKKNKGLLGNKEKNWGNWTDVLNSLNEDAAKELLEKKNDKEFSCALLKYMDGVERVDDGGGEREALQETEE